MERCMRPVQLLACRSDFFLAQRCAMGLFSALLVGCAETDDRPADDQAGLVLMRTSQLDSGLDLFWIMAVNVGNDMPAISFEALGGIIGEPAFDLTIDGDAVVIIEHGELAESQGAGKRADLMRDALHQAAVTGKAVSVVIDDIEAGTVELCREGFFGDSHAHGVAQTLAQRTGSGFDTRCVAIFGVAGGLGVELAKSL